LQGREDTSAESFEHQGWQGTAMQGLVLTAMVAALWGAHSSVVSRGHEHIWS
jgi:uncharacterized protein involved in copper resistance